MQSIVSKPSEDPSANVNMSATYTTHPCMLICPRRIESQRTFVIELRATEPAVIVEDPLLVWAMLALPSKFTEAEAKAIWAQEEKAEDVVDEVWEFALGEGLLLSSEKAAAFNTRLDIWKEIGWEDAGIYHEGTKDYPFVAMNHKDAFLDDNARMKEYEDEWMAPNVYQIFETRENVDLIKVESGLESRVLDRSVKAPLKDLSLFFDFCFGERFRLDHAYDEQNFLQLESLRKSIPSGGGRHPTEAFLLCLNENLGVSKGLYHYDVKNNRLEMLKAGDFHSEAEKLARTKIEDASAILFLSSLCERAMWRYRDPRSWRAFVIDVGHLEYMCTQVGASVDYTLKFTHQFDSIAAAQFLKTDPFRQPLMSVAALSLKGAAKNV